jgi:hypothetical protein
MAWTAAGADNAFLALPSPDGLVASGKKLFGNFTPQPASTTRNGFAALAVYDDPANGGNGDGVIDEKDAVFASLRLWIDANHDGVAQPGELHTLPSLGVYVISLKYTAYDVFMVADPPTGLTPVAIPIDRRPLWQFFSSRCLRFPLPRNVFRLPTAKERSGGAESRFDDLCRRLAQGND